MTEKELLEMAAKAAGINGWFVPPHKNNPGLWWGIEAEGIRFNALTDDGDALRLAVKLNLSADFFHCEILVGYTPNCNDSDQVVEQTGADPYAAARRAIVRAAAEIGGSIK
jgi:hypothetical protein